MARESGDRPEAAMDRMGLDLAACRRDACRVQLAPAPSAVKALERDLGGALFDRDRHRAALIDAGQLLLPEARKRRGPGSAQRAGGRRGRVVTGPGAIARVR
jgi:hypothetical protein